jgi:hypothetical protein
MTEQVELLLQGRAVPRESICLKGKSSHVAFPVELATEKQIQ